MSASNGFSQTVQSSELTVEEVDYQTIWQQSAPPVAWGTIALFIGYLAGYAIIIWAALSDAVSYMVATPICAYLAYVGFTVVHDAGHGSIIQLGSRFKPLETLMGWIAAFPLLLVPYPAFKRLHDRHHAFTNDPDRDPDHFSFGDKWYLVALNCLFIPIQYHLLMFTKLRHIRSIRETYITSFIYFAAILLSIVWLSSLGYFDELLYLLFIPNLIAVFALAMFFDYIPHYPHKSVNRYQNTRVYPGRLLNVLLLGQNYHLAHHMYPRVPWYKYKEVYENTKPDLDAHYAPVDHLTTVQALTSGLNPKVMTSPHAYGLVDNGNAIEMLLSVTKIERLNEESVAITFKLPEGTKLNFLAGQYIMLSKWLSGEQRIRCYSLCNSPLEHSSELTIGVKKVGDGVFSTFINEELKVGDELIVSGPFGDFTYPAENGVDIDNLCLIAGGSGITPILSILKTVLLETHRKVERISLIYVCKRSDSVMFKQTLNALADKHAEQLAITYLYSEELRTGAFLEDELSRDESLSGEQPTLGHSTSNAVIDGIDITKNTPHTGYYLCGPESLNQFVAEYLKKSHIDDQYIFSERFTTQVSSPIGERYPVGIQTSDGEEHQIHVAGNQTILEVAKSEGIKLPYACENGHCGTCKCKIVKGGEGRLNSLKDNIPALSKEDKEAGYTLACQYKPTGAISIREVGV
ncbi:fatty acid desaturase [Thalassotalea euphylliae]|uniref:fatty acid desaturase n=1 Tax=Thalassotalea euphylliae TaxID=1655234 RepID=UPI0036453EA0